MKKINKKLINNFVSATIKIFSNEKVLSEIRRISGGVKGEVKETGKAFNLAGKRLSGQKLTKEEKEFFVKQMSDLARTAGFVLPIYLIPLPFVSDILIITIDNILRRRGIYLLPSSFYPDKDKEKTIKENMKILKFAEYIKENDGGGGTAFATMNAAGMGSIATASVGNPGQVWGSGSGSIGSGDAPAYDTGGKNFNLNVDKKEDKKKTGKKKKDKSRMKTTKFSTKDYLGL